jgi:hypothetical protein
VMVLPEIAGTCSPGTMIPTKFNGSAAERVTPAGAERSSALGGVLMLGRRASLCASQVS